MYQKIIKTSFTLLFIFGMIHQAHCTSSVPHIVLKGKIPHGIVINKNRITLQKGYVFEKLDNGHVVSRMKRRQTGITGEFDCTCNGEQGGCSIVTTPTSVSCFSSGCSNCYMIVTVPGKDGGKLLSH